jgi:hypothetical protein
MFRPLCHRWPDVLGKMVEMKRLLLHFDLRRFIFLSKRENVRELDTPTYIGLCVAYEKSSKKRKHKWFVCESMNSRLAKSLSDLNGTDPYIHLGTIGGVFTELRKMFVRSDRQPSLCPC